jgi:hypothetical protein
MAKIEGNNKDKNVVIPIPALKHKWKMETSMNDDFNESISGNVVNVKFEFVSGEMSIKVEQPANYSKFFSDIRSLSNSPITFIHYGIGNTPASFFVVQGILDKHSYDLDYGLSETCSHLLTFKEIRVINNGVCEIKD